jgi:hypothetical protein
MSFNMDAYLARAEQAVKDNLRGAQIIGLILVEETIKTGYWELVYIAAWQRPDQCGTHRVNINSKGEAACFIGHYDLTFNAAIGDMIARAAKAVSV